MNIGQTVKNVGRLRQIVTVLASHGLSQVVESLGLARFVPIPRKLDPTPGVELKPLPWRVRKSMEELGPAFVKLGQWLSNRPDIVPADWVAEFKHLQDNVAPAPFDVIRSRIEAELEQPIAEVFAAVEPQPLASASMAQVHAARLKDGSEVVLKVQRPNIEPVILTDMSLLLLIAELAERAFPELRLFDPTGFVDEFSANLRRELDFTLEASNIMKIRSNLHELPDIVIPRVHWEYTTPRVLCMERLYGIKIGDIDALDAAGRDRRKLARLGAEAIFKQVIGDGLFHADLHPGNVFALEGDRIGLIDFGMVGRIPPAVRESLGAMFVAVMTEDYEGLIREYCLVSGTDLDPAVEKEAAKRFQRIYEPYRGLPISQVPVAQILVEMGQASVQFGVRVPSDLLLLFKVLMEIEGMGRRLDPDFDILEYGQRFTRDLLLQRYSPQRLLKDAWSAFRDFQRLAQVMPGQINELLRRLNRGPIETDMRSADVKQLARSLRGAGWAIGGAIVAATFWAGGMVLLIQEWGPHYRGLSLFGLANLVLGGAGVGVAAGGALLSWRRERGRRS